jgi:hypothetical protein
MPYKDPQRQRAAKAESARRHRAVGVEPMRGTRTPLVSSEVRLKTARDVLSAVERELGEVVGDRELGRGREPGRSRLCVVSPCARSSRPSWPGRVEALERALEARPAK